MRKLIPMFLVLIASQLSFAEPIPFGISKNLRLLLVELQEAAVSAGLGSVSAETHAYKPHAIVFITSAIEAYQIVKANPRVFGSKVTAQLREKIPTTYVVPVECPLPRRDENVISTVSVQDKIHICLSSLAQKTGRDYTATVLHSYLGDLDADYRYSLKFLDITSKR